MTDPIIIYCCKLKDCLRSAQEKGKEISPFTENGANIYKAAYQLVIGHHCDFCMCCHSLPDLSPD